MHYKKTFAKVLKHICMPGMSIYFHPSHNYLQTNTFKYQMYLIYSTTRRVHISEVTAKVLNDQFQLEPGNGGDRDDYIRDHKIQTYLVAIPEVYTLMC